LEEDKKRKLVLAYAEITNYLIKTLGYNTFEDTSNFFDTPMRASKALNEILLSKNEIEIRLDKHFKSTFPTTRKGEMVVLRDIEAISMCPHHLIPIVYKVTIGYIPKNRVLGLSKIGRIAVDFAKQPVLQEDYTFGLAKQFMERLECDGTGVHVEGLHGCMYCRGFRQKSTTITTTLRGSFLTDASIKSEFMQYLKG